MCNSTPSAYHSAPVNNSITSLPISELRPQLHLRSTTFPSLLCLCSLPFIHPHAVSTPHSLATSCSSYQKHVRSTSFITNAVTPRLLCAEVLLRLPLRNIFCLSQGSCSVTPVTLEPTQLLPLVKPSLLKTVVL